MAAFRVFFERLSAALSPYLDFLLAGGHWLFTAYRRFPVAYSALLYLFFTMASGYYPVTSHWLGGFLMMSLPLAMLGGFAACVYLFYRQQKMIAMAGLTWVLFSFLVAKRLVGTHNGYESATPQPTLNVLSFNSETFPEQGDNAFNASLLKADIACFQEYSPNRQIERQYASTIKKLTCFGDREVGLALFSEYPIVQQYGRVWTKSKGPNINGFICADIMYGRDTIRVINVHLWSMGVRSNQMVDALKAGKIGEGWAELVNTVGRLKEGFENRNEQLREVESYVTGSRFPVIICGDFNETPFGYAYGKLRQNFRNAFEEAGDGFGFTLNRHPYYVRIDQQFVSSEWHIKACETLSGVSFSDHFPVLAQYALKKKEGLPINALTANKPVNLALAE
ncbi:endonuclease/exonuclease/phosphatase family protein [Fibrella aquatica]|uniref:endonuclease/exonuclease/phosphatase family protein n=1 Tax=Fibrella aquatica TaxID=3242487 RepID=UPI003520E32A